MEFKEFINPEEQDYDIKSSLNEEETNVSTDDDQLNNIPDDIPEDTFEDAINADIKPTSVFDDIEDMYKRSSR